jgi:hypothetical protein
MSRRILFPALAASMLALYGGIASAQGPDRQGRGGGGPSMRAPGGGSGAAPQRQMNAPRAAPERPRVERPARSPDGPRGVERRRQAEPQARPRAAERQRAQQRTEQRRNVERRREAERATQRERGRAVERAEQRRNAERERNAERTRAAERERAARQGKQAEERQRREGTQPRDRQATDRVAERRNEMRLARERLGRDDRQKLRQAFDFRRARLAHASFDRRVGHRIPRSVRLFVIPAAVIALFPYYRDYRYVVVEDDICIVDPSTYEIVDVIDQNFYGGGARQEVAGLSLTENQMALVRDSIPRDFPLADVRLRLALGAEIPRDVELYEFSALLLDRVPKLRGYRFLVTEDQIVIVEPRDRSIALVIDRV